ncbi:hypothetical protein ACN3XK_54810 [Actinomadura welshii]
MTAQPANDDLTAALAARRELGPDYDTAFLATIIERLEGKIGARAEADARERAAQDREDARSDRAVTITIACVSLTAAIPLTAIAVGTVGLTGFVLTWVCLTLINLGYALRPRGR